MGGDPLMFILINIDGDIAADLLCGIEIRNFFLVCVAIVKLFLNFRNR